MKRTFTTTAKILYASLILVVVGFALLFLGTRFDIFGYEVKVVQSGSMEPAIAVGSIVVIAPVEQYQVGDIITFGQDTRTSVPITHRIISIDDSGRAPIFSTKGDANEDPDGVPVPARDVIGKVMASVPFVGYAIEFARTPLGFILLVGIPALIIVLDEVADIAWEIHKYRHRRRKERAAAAGKGGTRQKPLCARCRAELAAVDLAHDREVGERSLGEVKRGNYST